MVQQNSVSWCLYHLYTLSAPSPILQNSVALILTLKRKSQVSLLNGWSHFSQEKSFHSKDLSPEFSIRLKTCTSLFYLIAFDNLFALSFQGNGGKRRFNLQEWWQNSPATIAWCIASSTLSSTTSSWKSVRQIEMKLLKYLISIYILFCRLYDV